MKTNIPSRSLPVTVAAMFVVMLLVPAAGGTPDVPLAEPTPSLIEELLAMGDAEGVVDPHALEALLQPREHLEFPNPTATLEHVRDLHARYVAAETPQDYLAIAAGDVERLPVNIAPGPLVPLILEMYALHGEAPTPADVLQLTQDLDILTQDQQLGLAILTEATNRAITLRLAGGDYTQGAMLLLDAVDVTEPLMTSASVSCDVFEDPLQFIYVGSVCDDVVLDDAARVLQIDPAGDDTYYSNSGGAQPTGLVATGAVVPSFHIGRQIGEVQDNISFEPITPIAPFDENYTTNATNPDWLSNATMEVVQNQTGMIPRQIQFLQEFVDSIHLSIDVNESRLQRSVPVALHADFAGDDTYSHDRPGGQGTGEIGGIGILVDRSGDDSYSCAGFCQGYATVGIGLLLDQAGDDVYEAQANAQGTGNGGYLFDLGGGDDHYQGGTSTQGSNPSFLIPNAMPSVLLDDGGNDFYMAGTGSQGVGNQLIDLGGHDTYIGGVYAQGVGVAATDGLLLDAWGDDTYIATNFAQGVGTIQGQGLLVDLAGNDVYYVEQSGQGVGAGTGAIGLLYDESGDDTYTSGWESQGFSIAGSVGALIDRSGDDTYTAGARSQGAASSQLLGGFLGILVDGHGDDTYIAGNESQGAGSFLGMGLLVDAWGGDSYSAGSNSQGSGANFGVGVLVDGASDAASATAQTDIGDGSIGFEGSVSSPATPPGGDTYTAGNFSQGSSGSGGGIGLLLDRHDQEGAVGIFTAGNHSQGSAVLGGTGVLSNANGHDSYTAGEYSQGASLGGVAILFDEDGDDTYTSTSTGQGYGKSDLANASVAVAMLLDTTGNDSYDAMGNNECRARGTAGLAVDTEAPAVPGTCPAAAVTLVDNMLAAAEAAVFELVGDVESAVNDFLTDPAAPAPNGTVYFHDDMENGTSNWSVTTDGAATTTWQLVDETLAPRAGPNARSGDHYWYVGLPVAGAGYNSLADATLTSVSIDLSTAVQPELRAWFAGSSETGFDRLSTFVVDDATGARTQVLLHEGSGTENPLPSYQEGVADLTAFAGTTVHLEFVFMSDSLIEDGQGWNIDDVTVKEA